MAYKNVKPIQKGCRRVTKKQNKLLELVLVGVAVGRSSRA